MDCERVALYSGLCLFKVLEVKDGLHRAGRIT